MLSMGILLLLTPMSLCLQWSPSAAVSELPLVADLTLLLMLLFASACAASIAQDNYCRELAMNMTSSCALRVALYLQTKLLDDTNSRLALVPKLDVQECTRRNL